ncbi:MAG TPA: hypothetical protein VEY95_01075 [Azospirillaceae bacterium]|nr:hypothetical protein [Azospirillaceae bacterium]
MAARQPKSRFRQSLLAASALVLAFAAGPAAAAGEPEAKEVARANNCPPGKVEVLRQLPGPTGSTLFKVNCTGGSMRDMFVRVECRGNNCTLLR